MSVLSIITDVLVDKIALRIKQDVQVGSRLNASALMSCPSTSEFLSLNTGVILTIIDCISCLHAFSRYPYRVYAQATDDRRNLKRRNVTLT